MARAVQVQARAKKTRFPSRIGKPDKRWAGRTDVAATPLHMRTIGPDLDEPTRRWVQDRAERRLGKYAPHIERLSFRFEDVNGPRGGQDIVCRGKVVLSGQQSAIVEKRAGTARDAFNLVSRQLERGVGKAVSRHGQKVRLQSSVAAEHTAQPDTKSSNTRRTTTTREAAVTGQPARKSTRGSHNRLLSGTKLARKAKRTLASPKRRAGTKRAQTERRSAQTRKRK